MSDSKLLYLQGYVTVAKDGNTDLEQIAASIGGDIVGAATVLESIDPVEYDGMDEVRGEIDGAAGFIAHEDPITAMTQLQGEDVQADVIHAVGLANHWSLSPGTKPEPVPGDLPEVPLADPDLVIAVVDSGIVPSGPGWFIDHILFDPFDEETVPPGMASHGTFVASLLRQLACTHTVSMARLPLVHGDWFAALDRRSPGVDVSTEVHLLEAVIRLLRRSPLPRYLNLSLGSYTQNDVSSLLMTLTVNRWLAAAPESQVFAAGGNEYEAPPAAYSPFWPAALDDVTGVGASNPYGDDVVWDYHAINQVSQRHAPPGARPWIDRKAAGTDLVGLSGLMGDTGPQLVKWSGSSFATPVAVAMDIRGTTKDTVHADVDGLSYFGGTSTSRVERGGNPCALTHQG